MDKAVCSTNKEIPEALMLGNLLFYSISDILIKPDELKNIFQKAQLPEKYIRDLHPSDVFRRASSSIKNITFTEGDSKKKLEVDEVICNDDKIVRTIGIKEVNSSNAAVGYTPAAYLTFERALNRISAIYSSDTHPALVTAQEDKIVHDAVQTVFNNYTQWTSYHNKDTVRNIFNKIIQDTHPVSLVNNGICKFVPKIHTDILYSMKEASSLLQGYTVQGAGKSYVELIPVINTEEQQKMIKESSEKEIRSNLNSFVMEIREIVKTNGTLSPRAAKSYIARFNALKEQVQDYEAVLGTYLDVLRNGIKKSLERISIEDYASI